MANEYHQIFSKLLSIDLIELTVLIGDHLPKLGTNLVTALTTLNVNNFAHLKQRKKDNISTLISTHVKMDIP